jgi:hypothetical protein
MATDQHPATTAYEKTIAGIPDCFSYMTGEAIREIATYAVTLNPDTTEAVEADTFIRGHFEYLTTWHDALDGLDSEIRGDVVEGSIPDWAQQYLKAQARELFDATTDLQRAVCEYHHGTTGPRLAPEYGHAYALSNSALSPF